MLLEAARRGAGAARFVQISTDEVYGSVPEGASRETDELKPRNPYSASKAAPTDWRTATGRPMTCPVIITRASNNYGPVSVSGKSDSAVHHQRARRTSPCRSTATAETCVTGCTWRSLPRTRSLDRTGPTARSTTSAAATKSRIVDLTHAILALLDRPASLIKRVADRPGSRSPLRSRHDQAPRRSAGRRTFRSPTGLREPSSGIARTMVVAADQGTGPGLPRVPPGTVRQSRPRSPCDSPHHDGPAFVTGAGGFVGRHLLELPVAAFHGGLVASGGRRHPFC